MDAPNKKMILGIDEAGRGPIIGPMVLAGVVIEEGQEVELSEIGVKDSKLLTPEKREKLFEKIKKIAKKIMIIEVSSKEIDSRFAVSTNLNVLEAAKMAELINKLKPDVAIIDCPMVNCKKFKSEVLGKFLDHKCEIIAENYADSKYLAVGAASIIAKVTRDARIKEIEKAVGFPIGVGYTHDARTLAFVEKALSRKDWIEKYIRKSWLTFDRIKNEKAQKKLSDGW